MPLTQIAIETPNTLLKISLLKNFICFFVLKVRTIDGNFLLDKRLFHSKISQSYIVDAKNAKRLRHKIEKIKKK
jgi:hypothetical protein